MGTREGVEKLPLDQGAKAATKRQQDLIASVVKKIPGTVSYPEYQKFLEQNTRAAATEFLNAVMSKEDQAEEIGKLVTYMAERPGVVKLGKHGLFSQTDEPIELEEAAAEVANHEGYIWTHIVSLHREDAERLGYNNAEAWKSLVRRNITAIAEAHKIPISDLQWYAAFHDTGHHPHIHLMVYSKGQEGYLSKQSIDQLRSAFGNDIFRQEQYQLFQIQTGLRQDIKAKSEQKIQELMEIPLEPEVQPVEPMVEVSDHIRELYEELLGEPYPDSEDSNKADLPDVDELEPPEVPMKEPTVHQTMAAAGTIIAALAKLIEDKCMSHQRSLEGQIDHRLRSVINEKKQALGLKIERTQKPTYQTEEEYEMSR